MPLRLKHRSGRKGVINGTLGDITGSVVGSFATVNNVTGVLKPVLADVTGGLSGFYQPTAQRTGAFAGTLANVTGLVTGDANTEPVWTTAANLGSVTPNTPFSFPLTATDIDGDAITITRIGSLPSNTQEVFNTQSGNNRSVIWSSTTGLPAGTYQVTYDADDGSPVSQDWNTRIAGSGVVWYHDFRTSAEVDNFRWTGGVGLDRNDAGIKDVVWDSTQGIIPGSGSLKCVRPAGSSGDDSGWWRPFSPIVGGTTTGNGRGVGQNDPGAGTIAPRNWNALSTGTTNQFNTGYYGNASYQSEFGSGFFDGTDYYVQVRMKCPSTNWTQSGVTAGKAVYFTTTLTSLTAQEINLIAINDQVGSGGQFHFYRSGSPSLQDDHVAHTGQDLSMVMENGGGTCNFGSNPGACWAFPGDTWVTLLFYFNLGLSGAASTVLKVWAAYAGDANNGRAYTLIWDQNCVRLPYETGVTSQGLVQPKGHNAMLCSPGANMVGTPSVDYVHRFGQIIFSKNTIPCPQDGA